MPTATITTTQSTLLEGNHRRVSLSIDNPDTCGSMYVGVGYGRNVSTSDYDYKIGPGTGRTWKLAFFGPKIRERWVIITDVANLLVVYVESVV